jgi:hypothetical protein
MMFHIGRSHAGGLDIDLQSNGRSCIHGIVMRIAERVARNAITEDVFFGRPCGWEVTWTVMGWTN